MNITNNQVEKILETKAGKLWEKYGKKRIYLDIKTALGMDVDYYKTGNISSCFINGEKISNSKANKILSGKCFIDLNNDNKVVFQWATDELIDFVEEYLNQLEEEQEEEQEEQEEEQGKKLTWEEPNSYYVNDIDLLYSIEILEWESSCGSFRIYKRNEDDSRFYIQKKTIVEMENLLYGEWEEEAMIQAGNKNGYSTFEEAKTACNKEV